MSEAAESEILTREELDHLFSGSTGRRDGSADEHLAQRLPRTSAATGPMSEGDSDLRLAVAGGAGAWGRRMASSYQRRIECALIAWQELTLEELAPAILDVDEAVCFSVESEIGFVLMSRPLFGALHGLEFGAGSSAPRMGLPRRPFTGIEKRLLMRLVRNLLVPVESAWQKAFPYAATVTETCGRESLLKRAAGRIVLASLDVTALDVVGRLRIALPAGVFQTGSTERVSDGPRESQRLERGVVGVPLTLQAELGTVELTLGQLARLQVGDELVIEPAAENGLLIRIGGTPKFRAVAGEVGNRLAAKAVERL